MRSKTVREILDAFAAYYMLEGEQPEALLRITFDDGRTVEGFVRDDGEGGYVFTHDYRRIVPAAVRRIDAPDKTLFDLAIVPPESR